MARTEPLVVGVDVGGTHIRAALFVGTAPAGSIVVGETPRVAERILPEVVRVIHEAVDRAARKPGEIAAVGLGFPGLLDPVTGVSRRAVNLGEWRGGPVKDQLEAALGRPVTVENDVRAAGYAEFRQGAGRGCKSLVYVSVGTGVGGAIFWNGAMWTGSGAEAGELGHMVLDASAAGDRCHCGQVGDVEALISGGAIERRAASAAATGRAGDILAAGLTGDSVCSTIRRRVAHYLELVFVNIKNVLDPERIVMGGGLGVHPAYPVEEAAAGVRRAMLDRQFAEGFIRRAELGGRSGVWGAALLARESVRRPEC